MDPRRILTTRCEKPKAKELAELFIEYCDIRVNEDKLPLTKLSFYVFLGISKETYFFWQDEKLNKYLTDEEFTERLTLIKKIDSAMENDLGDGMMNAKYPTGMIFTLKNAYQWTDRPQNEPTLNIKFGGYMLPADTSKDTKKLDDNNDFTVIE